MCSALDLICNSVLASNVDISAQSSCLALGPLRNEFENTVDYTSNPTNCMFLLKRGDVANLSQFREFYFSVAELAATVRIGE